MRLLRFTKAVLAATALAGLAGCAVVRVDMAAMAVNHNETVDQIDRNALLLNILRAADEQPLTFTALSYVGGNGSVNSNFGVNEVGFANEQSRWLARVLGIGLNTGLSVGSGFSYTLSSLDNEQFTRSFLADVPLDRLYFLHSGTYLDNAVLWTLTAQAVDVVPSTDAKAGERRTYQNAPERREWTEFQNMVTRSMKLGLSMEEYIDEVPVGPRLSRDEATYQLGTVIGAWNPPSWGSPMAGAARPVLVEVGGSEADRTHQLVMTSNKIRFCFNPPQIGDWPYDGDLLCRRNGTRDAWAKLHAGRKGTPAQPITLQWRDVNLRSPREVFYFLGALVRAQVDEGASPWMVEGSAQGGSRPKPLITVVCGRSPQGLEPLAVATHRGRTCHVPRRDDSHSAHVLQYLSLLVAMSKVPGAVTTSPTLLVR